MSVDEYMKGWHIGAMPTEAGDNLREHYEPSRLPLPRAGSNNTDSITQAAKQVWTADMQRGFEAGRGAMEVAERVEQERREACPDPHCELKRGHGGAHEFKLYVRGPR